MQAVGAGGAGAGGDAGALGAFDCGGSGGAAGASVPPLQAETKRAIANAAALELTARCYKVPLASSARLVTEAARAGMPPASMTMDDLLARIAQD